MQEKEKKTCVYYIFLNAGISWTFQKISILETTFMEDLN